MNLKNVLEHRWLGKRELSKTSNSVLQFSYKFYLEQFDLACGKTRTKWKPKSCDELLGTKVTKAKTGLTFWHKNEV